MKKAGAVHGAPRQSAATWWHLLWSLTVLLFPFETSAQHTDAMPFRDPSLSVDQRVNDLVPRLTLDEKIAQMMNDAPAIPRLGIPANQWWNEALHGAARAGIATVFPQAIGLAATWDSTLIHVTADVISTEARAKYHEGVRTGDPGQFRGLTIWSPNINIFRDPRWGRGQETYGEDPYLTSRIGLAFVAGLQGNDPKYFKTIATPKHFAVHSGPEATRHVFDAVVSRHDECETYLPAFEALIREGRANSIMSAYNRLNGIPCSADRDLLMKILRQEWHFGGYVVSDCDAVDDVFRTHQSAPTLAEAAAGSVKAGTDLNCGTAYRALNEAVERGLISEAEIDVSVRRLFEARFRLGLFDPPARVPYAGMPIDSNDTPGHRALARTVAQESIVLLKNEAHLLPLDRSLKSVCVVGPNANDARVMFGNYNGTPSRSVTVLEGIRSHLAPGASVRYVKGCNWVTPSDRLQPVPHNLLFMGEKNGLRAEYFGNPDLTGEPILVRHDKTFAFDWRENPPAGLNRVENFSVRWTGKISMPETGDYVLSLKGDDGFRLFIDSAIVIDAWHRQPFTQRQATVRCEGGRKYDIRIEYFQAGEDATLSFEYMMAGAYDPFREAVELASSADVVIFCGGISPSLEGEEMPVPYPGFVKGDRTSLDLPAIQDSLLKALHATGKPIVLVLMSGSALAVNWADDHLPAILQAWYPGEEGGNAVADILFGDGNPAGRLPVTFYRSARQLPSFDEYAMKGRTYRYFAGDPLYPFGHGLSYSSFRYDEVMIPASAVIGKDVPITVHVTNTSRVAGDEVVQLYVAIAGTSSTVPIRSLQGFRRIHLMPGETRAVSFTLTPAQLSVVDEQGDRYEVPSRISIAVGGGQPDVSRRWNIPVVTGTCELAGAKVRIR